MSRSNKTISGVLAADVLNLGTFIVAYPNKAAPESGVTNAGDFFNAVNHTLIHGSGNVLMFPQQFFLAFGEANITVTNRSGGTILAGTTFFLEIKERGEELYADDGKTKIAEAKKSLMVLMELGAPDLAVATGVALAQVLTLNTNGIINGTLAAGGVAVLDVPRNVQLVSSLLGDTTQVVTIFGFGMYGLPLRENITLAGTTVVAGNKAFRTITRVTVSATTGGSISIGSGVRLGLPIFLPSVGHVLREMQNGAVAAAGVLVAGFIGSGGSTAVSGDIRGTYTPAVAPNGTNVYELIASLPDAGYKGIPQFNG